MGIIRPLRRSTAGTTEQGNRSLAAEEIIEVDQPTVVCDGGDGPLGHPRVYLNMGSKREIECPYCSRRFVLKEGVSAASGH